MDRALVVMDPDESAEQLLAEAGDCVRGTDTNIILLAMMTEDAVDRELEILNQIGKVEDRSYGESTPLEGAKHFAADVAEDVLDDAVDYTAVSRLVDDDAEAEIILSVADEYGCDHIFIAGRKRSPTGKALFGDRTQQVLLNAASFVTVAMQE